MTEIVSRESATGSRGAWPVELRLSKDKKTLTVSFEDGAVFTLDAEYLRVESPSAEVQGHSPSERKYLGGKQDVQVLGLEEVGRYAVRLLFDDLHNSGIYSWDYLYELGHDRDTIWSRYLEGLAASGGRRERGAR